MFQGTLTVLGKEFGSYFKTRLGYFILFIYAVVAMASTFYGGSYFQLAERSLYSFFSFQPEIFILLVPALTMKLWADERRYGTLELILSQPVGYPALVLGKFLAAWLLCGLMLAMSFPLWMTTGLLSGLDNLNVLYNYLGCWLIAGAVCAIGCVVSSFNSNPIAAYLLTVFCCWIVKLANFDYLIRKLNVSNELFIRISQSLNFDRHFENLILGQLTWSGLTYYITLILAALWLNVVSIEYKRS